MADLDLTPEPPRMLLLADDELKAMRTPQTVVLSLPFVGTWVLRSRAENSKST